MKLSDLITTGENFEPFIHWSMNSAIKSGFCTNCCAHTNLLRFLKVKLLRDCDSATRFALNAGCQRTSMNLGSSLLDFQACISNRTASEIQNATIIIRPI